MDFLNGSFRIGRWFGITVRVHILFLVFLGFRLFQAGAAWREQLEFSLMLFGIVLLHEFGHCFGARSVRGRAEDILLWPLGGLAFAQAPMTPWAQFVTVAAGPAVNVLFCLISGAALVIGRGHFGVLDLPPFHHATTGIDSYWQIYARLFFDVNWMLLMFNLLPIYPMDGGQLFQCLIWPFVGLQRATLVACYVGIVGAIGLGLWSLQAGGGMLLMIAIFGGMTCVQRLRMLQAGMIQDDRFMGYDFSGGYTTLDASSRNAEPRAGLFERLFGRRARKRVPSEPYNPNPGGWQKKLDEEQRVEAELDRILAKVHEHGLHSLTYVERQTLEHATRERQAREREFNGVD